MFTKAELDEHRADAESLMVDSFAGFSPDGYETVGGKQRRKWKLELTGFLDPDDEPLDVCPGKSQAASTQGGDVSVRTAQIGDVDYVVYVGGLHLPIGAYLDEQGRLRVTRGWEFQCVAVGDATDPAQLGRRWHVAGATSKSWLTARRLDVAEVPSLVIT